MAGDLGGWFRRLLGRGPRNGNGTATLPRGGGNGVSELSLEEDPVQVLARREADRETSALLIQDGIRDLAGLLKGIEGKLEVQNDQGRQVWNRLQHLAESLQTVPGHGEKSEEILQAIQEEIRQQGDMGREVAVYFRTIPRILENLEAGGPDRKTQLELARGLVQEMVSQGQKLSAFQRGAQEMAGVVRKLSDLGESQLTCLQGVESGIRTGFAAAGEIQSRTVRQWQRRFRWALAGGISIAVVGLLLLGAGIATSVTLARSVIQEIRTSAPDQSAASLLSPVSAPEMATAPVETEVAEPADASASEEAEGGVAEDVGSAEPSESEEVSAPAPAPGFPGMEGTDPIWTFWFP